MIICTWEPQQKQLAMRVSGLDVKMSKNPILKTAKKKPEEVISFQFQHWILH